MKPLFARLLFLFIVIPLADLFLLLWIAKYTSVLFTVGLIILTAIIGASLAKWQGRDVQRKISEQLKKQQFPSEFLTDGAMILFASALLLTPGLLTDAFGFSLLIPPCRNVYKGFFKKYLKKNFRVHMIKPEYSNGRPYDANTIDGEVVGKSVPDPSESHEKPHQF